MRGNPARGMGHEGECRDIIPAREARSKPGGKWSAFGMFSSCSQWLRLPHLARQPHVACACVSARSKSLVMGEQTGPPSRPSSPSLQDRVLKSGWLKKQRSIMKNWQQRWFVLRGDQLFYYKDEDETKPQVRLLCNTVHWL